MKISNGKRVFSSGKDDANLALLAITRLVNVSLNTLNVAHPSSSMDGLHGWGAKSPRNAVISIGIFARKLQDLKNATMSGVTGFIPEAFCD